MIKMFERGLSPQHQKYVIWFLAAAGLLLRLEYLREFAAEIHCSFAIGPDVQEYHERAMELVNGKIFPDEPEIHAPLYSMFLSLIYRFSGGSVIAARCCQLLLNWAAFLALAGLLKRKGASFGITAGFLFFAMFTPVIFFHNAELISESLTIPLLAAFFWSLELAEKKKWWYAAAGAALGGMILTHGLLLFFVLAEILFFLFRKKWQAAGLLAAGIVLTVLPFITCKSIHYGELAGIQGNSAYNLWIGNNPDATGGCYLRPGRQWRTPLEKARKEAVGNGTDESRIFLREVISFPVEHPGRAIVLIGKKLALIFSPGEPVSGADPEYLIRRTTIQQCGRGMMAVVLALAVCGIFFAIKDREKAYVHYAILGGSLFFAMILTVVSGRYRTGLFPALIIFSSLAICRLGRKALIPALPALLFGIWWITPTGMPEAMSIMGEAHYRKGNFTEAKEMLEIAEKTLADPSRFDNMLGAIAEENGNFEEAERRYINAVTGEPAYPEAYLNLAHLYFNVPGKRAAALGLIYESLKIDPEQASAYDMLGMDMVQKQDLQSALAMFEAAAGLEPENELYIKKVNVCRELLQKGNSGNAP